MGNYNRDRGARKRDYGRGGDSRRTEMYDAVCDECGRDCKVPFKPTGNKPVYCSSCFERQTGGRSEGRSDRRSSRRDSGKRDYQDSRMYTAVCDECGKECEVPFKPSGDKPVYCSSCFERRSEGRSSRRDGGRDRDRRDRRDSRGRDEGRSRDKGAGRGDKKLQEQINVINGKLDSILRALSSSDVAEGKPEKGSKKDRGAKATVAKKKAKQSEKPVEEKVEKISVAKKTPAEKKPKKTVKKKTETKAEVKTKAKVKPKAKTKAKPKTKAAAKAKPKTKAKSKAKKTASKKE